MGTFSHINVLGTEIYEAILVDVVKASTEMRCDAWEDVELLANLIRQEIYFVSEEKRHFVLDVLEKQAARELWRKAVDAVRQELITLAR